jgi:hypothetical protein
MPIKDLWRRLWAPKNPGLDESEPVDSEPSDVSEEGPAERRGISMRGVPLAVVVSAVAVALGLTVVLLVLRDVLPSHFILAIFPLAGGTVALLTSDVWLTREEKLDRWLGLSFNGDRRQAARRAYADLWRQS